MNYPVLIDLSDKADLAIKDTFYTKQVNYFDNNNNKIEQELYLIKCSKEENDDFQNQFYILIPVQKYVTDYNNKQNSNHIIRTFFPISSLVNYLNNKEIKYDIEIIKNKININLTQEGKQINERINEIIKALDIDLTQKHSLDQLYTQERLKGLIDYLKKQAGQDKLIELKKQLMGENPNGNKPENNSFMQRKKEMDREIEMKAIERCFNDLKDNPDYIEKNIQYKKEIEFLFSDFQNFNKGKGNISYSFLIKDEMEKIKDQLRQDNSQFYDNYNKLTDDIKLIESRIKDLTNLFNNKIGIKEKLDKLGIQFFKRNDDQKTKIIISSELATGKDYFKFITNNQDLGLGSENTRQITDIFREGIEHFASLSFPLKLEEKK